MIIQDLYESHQICPECGGPSFSDLILAEKKDACYHKVKASAKVWPSAYASGRLVQCRKKGADNYGNKSESMSEGSKESYMIIRTDAEGKKDVFAGNFDTYDQAQKELDACLAHPLHTKYKQKFEIKRKGGEQGVAEAQLDEKCWDGYEQQGMKNKSGRQVPNCVPAESVNEMDKSQTPPGRDGSNDSDAGKKEYTATPTTPGAVARQGGDILNKAFKDSQRVDPRTGKKMNTKGVAEKLGDNCPKLGSKRDAGKSVRKWRSARGLDETGVAETMATFSAKASTRNSGSGEFRGVSIPSDMKHPEWKEPTWSFQEIAQKLGIPVATLNLLAFNRIGGFPEPLSGLSARYGSKKYYKQSEVKRWVNANNVREKLKQGVAEADDSNFVGFMNKTLADKVDSPKADPIAGAPDFYRNAAVSTLDGRQGFKNALKFGLKALSRLDPETRQQLAAGSEQAVANYLTNVAERSGQMGDDTFVEEDISEVQDYLSDVFHDPSINSWKDVLQQSSRMSESQLDEKSVSQAQFRTMAAAAHNPEFAKKVGISQDVAQEFHSADKHSNYKKLPDRTTEGEQQKGADYRDPPEADYGDDYQDMVARVKKLAGLGPLKTVYDPQKRVYRNVPTAVQPKK